MILNTIETERHIRTEEFLVNMGPQHPATHGVLRLILKLDGEQVVSVEPDIGFLHRNFEKIAENRTYPQVIPFTDRLDYVASMSANFGYCLAVEKLMKVEVPRRAQILRVIMAELQRIASHLVFYGTFALDIGAVTPFLYAFRERERILDLFEMVCGARLTYNYFRIGGVSRDLPEGFVDRTKEFLNYFKPKLKEYDDLLSFNVIFLERTKKIGILLKEKAIDYACSGPVLRGSGIKWDLRVDEPYSIYSEFEFDVPTGKTGDSFDRYYVRLLEMRESCKIIEQALLLLSPGEIVAKIPRVIKPPAGEVFVRTEAPRGELGFYIVSDGSTKPYRVKVRSSCFVNLSSFPEMVNGRGYLVADLMPILGSIDIVLGEVDR